MIYALAHFTKLKPTIDLVKCHYIKAEITEFHLRNQIISENAWNALMRIEGSIIYTSSITPRRDITCIYYLHFLLMHS